MLTRFWLCSALCLLALSSHTAAQQPVQIVNPCFQQACFHAYTAPTVAASAATVFTIQEPATGPKQVQFLVAVIQCPGQSFTVDQAQNGTVATATAGSAIALQPSAGKTAKAQVWTASNVGTGAVTAAQLTFSGGPVTLDMSQRSMGTVNHNYSITLTNTGTGSCTGSIDVYWSELQ